MVDVSFAWFGMILSVSEEPEVVSAVCLCMLVGWCCISLTLGMLDGFLSELLLPQL